MTRTKIITILALLALPTLGTAEHARRYRNIPHYTINEDVLRDHQQRFGVRGTAKKPNFIPSLIPTEPGENFLQPREDEAVFEFPILPTYPEYHPEEFKLARPTIRKFRWGASFRWGKQEKENVCSRRNHKGPTKENLPTN